MAIQGSLRTLRLPELLSLLLQLRKTGVLRIVSPLQERAFLVQSGNLLFATTSNPRKRIGAILARMRAIKEEELEIDQSASESTELYLGEKLVELGRITQKDLDRAVKTQILETVEEVLDWEDGVFHFDESEVPFSLPRGNPVSAQNVLLEATRRHDERKLLRKVFPDLQQVLAKTQAPPHAPLSPEEASILKVLDRPTTIESLLFSAQAGPQATAASLRKLIEKGCVALMPKPAETNDTSLHLPLGAEVPGLLFRTLNAQEFKLSEVAEIVALDPILAAKTLRAAAEQAPRTQPAINSISSALERLGTFRVRNALFAETLRGLFYPKDQRGVKEWSEYARLAARAARTLAEVVGYPFPQEAYLAALISDLGAHVLLAKNGDSYREIIAESSRRKRNLLELEQKAFGTTHPAVGAELAESWHLPKNLIHVIRNHHKSDCDPNSMLLNVVAAASSAVVSTDICIGWVAGWDLQFERALDLLNFPKSKALALLDPAKRLQGQRSAPAFDFKKTPAT